jgi:hypothetical protein
MMGAGGYQKVLISTLRLPAAPSYADFFSVAVYFGNSSNNQRIQKPSLFNDWPRPRRSREPIYFHAPGGRWRFLQLSHHGPAARRKNSDAKFLEYFLFRHGERRRQKFCREITQGGGVVRPQGYLR